MKKTAKIKTILLYVMTMYVLNKELVDWMLGGASKLIYYGLVAGCALLGMLQLLTKERSRSLVLNYVAYCVIVLLNGLILSNSEQFKVGIIEYVTNSLVFFSLLFLMSGSKEHTNLLKTIVVWGVITSVLAVYEYVAQEPVLPDYEGKLSLFQNGSSSYRATVFIGSPMILGVVLGAAMIIACYFHYKERNLLYLGAAVVILGGILCTGSRGPLLCAVGGMVVMYAVIFLRNGISRATAIVLGAGCGLCLLVVLFLLLNPDFKTGIEQVDFLIYRFTSSFDFSNEWGNVERLNRWGYYIGEFLKRPMFGYGLASTSAEVSTNQMVTAHGITTESGVLARLVETGLVGTIAYYSLLILSLKKGLRGLFRDKLNRDQSDTRFFAVGVVALLLFEDVILQISLDLFCNYVMWFALAYVVNRQLQSDELEEQVYRKHGLRRAWLRKKSNERNAELIQKNADSRIAVVLHLFYDQSWVEIKEYLKNLDAYSFDLYITVTEGRISQATLDDIQKYHDSAKVTVCPNMGFDLAPFLRVLKTLDLDDYDIVIKLQSKSTKRSWIYIYDQLFLRRDWFVNLFEGVLGADVVHTTVDKLRNDSKTGLVAAENLIVRDPLHKRQMIAKTAKERNMEVPEDYRFVAGTCFAVKAACLKNIQELDIAGEDFSSGTTSRGLSFGHYLERYICCTVQLQGLEYYGNSVCTGRRAMLKPVRRMMYRISSERLLEENLIFDPEWFFWQMDNKFVRFKYRMMPFSQLKYSNDYDERPFTQCPPYQYLKGNVEAYEAYCEYHRQNGLPLMSKERFDALRQSICENGYDERHIIVINERKVIMDGQHRACCLCNEVGEDTLVRVLQIRHLELKKMIRAIVPVSVTKFYHKVKG